MKSFVLIAISLTIASAVVLPQEDERQFGGFRRPGFGRPVGFGRPSGFSGRPFGNHNQHEHSPRTTEAVQASTTAPETTVLEEQPTIELAEDERQRGGFRRPVSGRPGRFSGRPSGFSGRPGGFSGRPSGFSGRPDGFSGRPDGFSGSPDGFSVNPDGFSGSPDGFSTAA